jgi:uncharacterized membrane protein
MCVEQIKPVHGFISKPKAGRGIAYSALILALIGLLIPAVPALINGPAYAKQVLALPQGSGNIIGLSYTLVVLGTMLLVLWHAVASAGWKRGILALFALMAVGFLAEGVGVNYGWVFGPYHYADSMPARIWGVPITVPISWLLNMYPAFYLALFLLPSELMATPKTFARRAIAILLISSVGAMICTLWDLMADPIFVPFGSWVWHTPGDYAPFAEGGIPFLNFVGWVGSGIVGNMILQLILRSTPDAQHVRSRYLDIYSPLAMYFAPFSFGIMVELLYMKHSDVILIGCMGMGNILLMVLTKIYLTNNGYREHQLALDMSEESARKLSGKDF